MGKQELEIDGRLIKKHTSNGWGKFFTEGLHDWHVDVVTNKVVSLITLELIKFVNVDLRKLQGVWLLLCRLLLGRLRSSLVHHRHLLLALWRHHWCLTWSHLWIWAHSIAHHSHGFLLLAISLLLSWAALRSSSIVILVPVLRAATVALSSSSASALESSTTSLAASHVHSTVVHLTTLVLVIEWLLSHIHATLSSKGLTLFALTLHEIDELGNIVPLFLVSCLLQVILSLPEINFKRFLVVAETS